MSKEEDLHCPKSTGWIPTGTVAVTLFVAVSIIETVLLNEFAIYAFVPSGVTATASGHFSTGTVAVTLFVDVSITKKFPYSSGLFILFLYP